MNLHQVAELLARMAAATKRLEVPPAVALQ
jgi:hypothetical protein